MDAATQRVKAADLARLATLRERREEEAQRAARIRACARDAAEAEAARARREIAARERERRDGEQAIYGSLNAGRSICVAALEERRARLDGLAEAVAVAKETEKAREHEAAIARDAYGEARAAHAVRARQTRKWERARSKILSARRAIAERAEEFENEDEVLTRIGAARMTS